MSFFPFVESLPGKDAIVTETIDSDPLGKSPKNDHQSKLPDPKLFPAYIEKPASSPSLSVWLNNESYTVLDRINDEGSSSSTSSSTDSSSSDSQKKRKRKSSKKRKRKDTKTTKVTVQFPPPPLPMPKLSFDGSEQFYVDKKCERGYNRVDTLHRPARPNYYSFRGLGKINRKSQKDKVKRYFSKKFNRLFRESKTPQGSSSTSGICEEAFMETNKQLNHSTTVNGGRNVSSWVDLVRFQDQTPLKSISKTQLAERKIDILNKAMAVNPASDELYTVYLEIANQVFPSFEVSKMIEKLLAKDPTNYVLWRGLIMATQGSMARCLVPDVLKLYERAMQQIYRRQKCDDTMMSE